MDKLNAIITVPSWAYDFCYYYFAVAAIVVFYTLYAVWQLLTLPGIVKKFVPITSLVISALLSGALVAVTTMMQFWICRKALVPSTEKFAVKCSGTSDCLAVNGTQPPGSTCSCGGRGLCGGCVMNNTMEPSSMNDYADGLAGFGGAATLNEGFRVQRPARNLMPKMVAGRR